MTRQVQVCYPMLAELDQRLAKLYAEGWRLVAMTEQHFDSGDADIVYTCVLEREADS